MRQFLAIFLCAACFVVICWAGTHRLHAQSDQNLPSRGGYFLALGTDASSWGVAYVSYNGTKWKQIRHSLLKNRSPFAVCTVNNTPYIGFSDGTVLRAPSWEIVKRGGYYLRGIAYGSGTYVAAGELYFDVGTILWSRDCREWHTVILDERLLSSVAYGNGMFVAVGVQGLCVTSRDGKKWTRGGRIDDINNFFSIDFHEGLFYATGSRNAQFTSADGKRWSPAPGPDGAEGYSAWKSIAFGGGRIVAAGLFKPAALFRKTGDGLAFEKSHPGSPVLNGVAYGNSIFVGCGNGGLVSWSADGRKWNTTKADMETLNSVAFGNGTFVAVGQGGGVKASRNGRTWRTVVPPCDSRLAHVAFVNNRFVAVGDYGRHLWSSDGVTWSDDYAESFSVYDLAHGNGMLVASGSRGGRAFLPDGGASWKTIPGISHEDFSGLEFGNNRFVAVGSNYYGGKGRVTWSPDGSTWLNDTRVRERFSCLACGNGRFVAVGLDGSAGWSADGITWHTAWTGGYWYNVTFGNGIFLALKRDRRIYTSEDGVRWNSHPMPPGDDLVTAAWGDNLFVAGGDNNRIALSKDGKEWEVIRIPTPLNSGGKDTRVTFHEIIYIPKR